MMDSVLHEIADGPAQRHRSARKRRESRSVDHPGMPATGLRDGEIVEHGGDIDVFDRLIPAIARKVDALADQPIEFVDVTVHAFPHCVAHRCQLAGERQARERRAHVVREGREHQGTVGCGSANARTAVELYVIGDSGDAWPGGRRGGRRGDRPSSSLDATSIIWRFFKTHPK